MRYIYVLHHPSFGTNIYKIGQTIDLSSRLQTYNTASPVYYSYVYCTFVDQLEQKIEKDIYRILEKYRISENNFFEVDVETIINTIKKVCFQSGIENDNEIEKTYVESTNFSSAVQSETILEKSQKKEVKHKCKLCNEQFNVHYMLKRHINNEKCTWLFFRKLNDNVDAYPLFEQYKKCINIDDCSTLEFEYKWEKEIKELGSKFWFQTYK